MPKKQTVKNKYMGEKHLKEIIKDQTKTIIEAADFGFGKVDKRFDKVDEKFKDIE